MSQGLLSTLTQIILLKLDQYSGGPFSYPREDGKKVIYIGSIGANLASKRNGRLKTLDPTNPRSDTCYQDCSWCYGHSCGLYRRRPPRG